MPLVDLGPAPTKKKATGLVDLGPAPTPIMEAMKAVEAPLLTGEQVPEEYRRLGVKEYRLPTIADPQDLPAAPVAQAVKEFPRPFDPSAPPTGFVPTLPKKVVEKRRPLEFRAAPKPTGWQKFKGFFVGDRPPLPPDADRMVKADRAFDIAIGSPLRVFLKFSKGVGLNIPDLMWAGIKRITPESMWDEKVKNMNLDQAMDWASGHDPSGFEKTVGELAEFVGRLRTAGKIGTSLGLLGKTPKDISVLTKAWETAKLFGLAAGFEQVAENLAEKVEPTEAEYGAEGKEAILRDMAIGAILSIAHSGVRGIWTKLRPTEQTRALKLLGLKKGATEREIIKASRKMALKTHPDKAKGLEGQFKKIMQAREFLIKGPKKDIVYAKRPPKPPARITGEIRPPEAPITAEARQAAEMDAELAEIQKPARIKPEKPTVAPPVAKVAPEPTRIPPIAEAVTEGKVVEQNFTMFAAEHGYTDDYSLIDHSEMSPSGRISKRADTAMRKRRDERFVSNRKGHEAYRRAILAGEIIDPSGKVTKERLLAGQKEKAAKKVEGRIAQIDAQIRMLESVGKGKKGTVRPSYQKQIDKLKAERKQLARPVAKPEEKVLPKTERYLTYEKTTTNPTNAGYMTFISQMKNKFMKAHPESIGAGQQILNQDAFTKFIKESAKPKLVDLGPAPKAKDLLGRPVLEGGAAGEQLELGIYVDKVPPTDVPTKVELQNAVAQALNADAQRILDTRKKYKGVKDEKQLYAQEFTKKRELFINPDNPLPEMRAAWTIATRGKGLFGGELKKPEVKKLEPEVKAEKKIVKDLSEKTRKAEIKKVEAEISQHDIYRTEAEALENLSVLIGPGPFLVSKSEKADIRHIIGKPGTVGYNSLLGRAFTTDPKRSEETWDSVLTEAAHRATGEEVGAEKYMQMGLDEFARLVNLILRGKVKKGAILRVPLENALINAKDDPFGNSLEMLAMKREMLIDGLTSAEINDNIREQAKQYGLEEADISAELVPVERVEYVEKKPGVVKEVARKGRQAKEKLSPEQAALEKARAVARKLNQPAYLFQRKGRYVVSKNKPTYPPKLPYREISPLAEGELTQKITWLSTPARKQKRLAPPEQPSNILMVTEVKNRFADKGLLDKNGKLKSNARRLAKTFTGKTDLKRMTDEELAKLGPMVDALTVDYRGIARIPTSTDIITKELADKIGKFKNIGFLERFREYKRVFEKIGLYHEVYEPSFKVEISSMEELFAFREKTKNMQKLIGKDKPTSQKLFRAIENPGKIKLTSKETKVLKWGQKYFRDWADRLGLTSEHRRKNYITHIFEREIDQILKEKHPLDPDLIRALEFITPKTVFNPYLQKRLGKKVGLKEDFWAAIEAYENRAIKKFYYEPLIKRIRVYEKFLPPNSARYLRNFITRLTNRPLIIDREVNQTLKEAAQEISKLPGGEQLAQYLTKGNASGMLAYNMTGIYYECWLGLRPASAIKNLSQHGLILAETGPVAFIKALKTTGKKRALLLANSEFLKTRKAGYLPGVDQTFIQALESKRRKVTMGMFKMADRKNVSDGFLAGYYEAQAKGLPDSWAYKRGDEVAHKTQYLYSKLGGSQFTQTAPGRVLGVLTTWPRNWAELMNDWIRAKPSTVYQDYYKSIGKEMPKVNWVKRRKSLWTYLALVSLAMLIHKKTPFKALYYTGWTSIKSLVDIASGKLAGLEIPRIVGNLIVGLALGDKRRLKQSWNEMKRFVVIGKELSDIITGKKDWINLFIYMETKKEKKKGVRKTRMERGQESIRKKRFEREEKMLRPD